MKLVKIGGGLFVSMILLGFSFSMGRGFGREEMKKNYITIQRTSRYDNMTPQEMHLDMASKLDALIIQQEVIKSICGGTK